VSRRCEIGTLDAEVVTGETHTRAPRRGSVSAEGGGTTPPTLGGGIGFSRDTSTVGRRATVGVRQAGAPR
jgi:hypothetical protein